MRGRLSNAGTPPGAGAMARAVRLEREDEIPAALREAGIDYPRPTVLLVGGAGRLDPDHAARIGPFLADALVPLVERLGGAIVDGGTDAGVMRLVGRARAEAGARFPLVGVAAVGTVDRQAVDAGAGPSGGVALEPRHTLVILVPGDRFGDESVWLQRTAAVLAGNRPPVTLVLNGGPITLDEAIRSADLGCHVVVVAGSGRSADVLAAAWRGSTDEPRAAHLARSGRLSVVDVRADLAALDAVLGPLLREERTR